MIEPQAIAAILLAVVTGCFAVWGRRQQLARAREQRAYQRDKLASEEKLKRLELDKIEAEARAEMERAKAERSAAEARRVVNASEGELIKVTAEAKQMDHQSQLLIATSEMMRDAFKQMAQDNARQSLVYDRVAENLNKQTEAIALVTSAVKLGQIEIKTELEDMRTVVHQAVREFPNTVDTKVNPITSQLRQIQDAVHRLTQLVQGAQVTALLTPLPMNPTEPMTPIEDTQL